MGSRQSFLAKRIGKLAPWTVLVFEVSAGSPDERIQGIGKKNEQQERAPYTFPVTIGPFARIFWYPERRLTLTE